MKKLTKKSIFTMKLKDEPIFIDCIELGLPSKKWATPEIVNMLYECEVLVRKNKEYSVVQHEIHSRSICQFTNKERVRILEKGRKILTKYQRNT